MSPFVPPMAEAPPKGAAALWAWCCGRLPGWLREWRCAACGRPCCGEPEATHRTGTQQEKEQVLAALGARHGLCPSCTAELWLRRTLTCRLCGLPVSGAPVERGQPDAEPDARPNATPSVTPGGTTSTHADGRPEGLRCGSCLASPPPWTAFAMVNGYEGSLRALLLRAKFQHDAALMRVLGELLATVLTEGLAEGLTEGRPKRLPDDRLPEDRQTERRQTSLPEAVIPVPLHPSRLRERGYNQCLELARPLVYRLGIPLWPEALWRVRATPFQRTLSRDARQRNVRGAFATLPEVRGRHVLVLDDVLTTGTTLSQITHTLQEAGAARVDVAVIARVPKAFV